jgi:hypothetical protein
MGEGLREELFFTRLGDFQNLSHTFVDAIFAKIKLGKV